AIEQDADLILFVYRDEVYNNDAEHKGIAELILGKHRNGSLGTVRTAFIPQHTRFANLSASTWQGARA
ncbi:DnaB-like helicase C-terminal domain-containing protein, partial [Pseudomonas viridiflava]|uniref:DnaB-like helicase C-terminal domain-containing protein n=1 Tax=Pseudomonas viridiflava TaxID=33069 RepID=UPI0023F9B2FC